MNIQVRYFGGSRELTGTPSETITLAAASVHGTDLRHDLGARHPSLAPLLSRMRLAVNGEFVDDDVALSDGDEVDVLPPVAGGAEHPQVKLCAVRDTALSVDEAMKAVGRNEAGAIAVFTGVVRDHAEGKAVARLDYEHHPTLALVEMRRVLEGVAADFPDVHLGATHRVGRLAIGDLAVVVVTSAPHRDEAFRACRAAIDRIKETVPIWKKEWGPEGDAHWVNLES